MVESARGIVAYVGTYTRGESEGIYYLRMDPETGALSRLGAIGGVQNPSFVALHPTGGYLYSVSEVADSDGAPGGAVAAFRVDAPSGSLTFLNHQSSGGTGPCHVNVDATGRYALVANYAGGSTAMLPIARDGSLAPASDFHQHAGSSVAPRRQEGPHAHSANLAPDNSRVFVCDLGLDRVMAYRLDLEAAKFPPNDPPFATLHPGAGPRHMTFDPAGRFAYVINELDSTMTVFGYDAARGALTELQTIGTLPEGFDGRNAPADVHIDDAGRFLYGSNRGHDSIVTYAVDGSTGKLSLVGHTNTGGRNPRNFGLDPSGRWMYVANQDTSNIVQFAIDRASGLPQPTGREIAIPMPVCVRFLAL